MSKRMVLLLAVVLCLGCSREAAPPPPPATGSGNPSSPAPPPPPPSSSAGGGGARQHAPPPVRNRGAEGAAPQLPRNAGIAPAEPTAESALQQQIQSWYRHLGVGTIQYGVPATLYWKEGSTVTVEISGPKGTQNDLKGATGSGSLKVSDFMKVELSCPDDPDEFTIVRDPSTGPVQFIAFNGSNRWRWTVTPRYTTSKSESLVITAWVLYSQDDKVSQPILSYRAAVRVHVPGFVESLKRLLEGDPEYWLRYGLPGGGGFIFVAGWLAWLRKRAKRKKRAHRAAVVHTP